MYNNDKVFGNKMSYIYERSYKTSNLVENSSLQNGSRNAQRRFGICICIARRPYLLRALVTYSATLANYCQKRFVWGLDCHSTPHTRCGH